MAASFASTLLSLILMHGISMTVWRHLVNQTMPLSVRTNNNLPRFTFQLSNTIAPPSLGSVDVSGLGVTTPTPAMLASSSQLVHSSIPSSQSAAYIQPIIQLHPIPIQLPSLSAGLPNYAGLAGLTSSFTTFPNGAGQLPNQQQYQSHQHQMIILPVTRPDSLVPSSKQPMFIQQIPAPVVQISPAMVTQASTLNPIRVMPPQNYVSLHQTSPTPRNFSAQRSRPLGSVSVDLLGGSTVNKTKSDPIRLTAANISNDIDIDLNSIISDDMLLLKDDIKWNGFRSICFYLLESFDGIVLPVDKIDPSLCTDIIVGHAYIGPNHLIWFAKPEDNIKRLKAVADLKAKNPRLKVFLSVKMGNPVDNQTINILAAEEKQSKFARSLVDIVSIYNLDGINFFWLDQNENYVKESKIDLITLIKLIRKECLRKGRLETILMATITGNPTIASKAYNITELARNVDYLSLLSFDYHFYSDDKPFTGHHSSLYPKAAIQSNSNIKSTDEVCKFWIKQNVPIRKLILAVPTFARTFNLAFPFAQGFNSPANGPGLGGGRVNYTRVCEFLKDGGQSEYDEAGQVPFAHRNFDWISYENERSLSVKARYAAKRMIGGLVTYALNYDDWTGTCREDSKSFPLQRVISSTLKLASLSSFNN